jgi:hypothetical protein
MVPAAPCLVWLLPSLVRPWEIHALGQHPGGSKVSADWPIPVTLREVCAASGLADANLPGR